ncbi:hypothetical protein FRC96_14950 [Lujinxingia vulgaris]|uniref:Uncharacterized protein n=1 Tax=Lujinxingia vulgaris TaxID=2600176 RepID=A0A5C6X511_9DELT|nr:hypothetical protein [Lujinxingia vulgaris]TXD33770.1 hypothetical protein FRC96_14950 [Lujinxingia vulgaris]
MTLPTCGENAVHPNPTQSHHRLALRLSALLTACALSACSGDDAPGQTPSPDTGEHQDADAPSPDADAHDSDPPDTQTPDVDDGEDSGDAAQPDPEDPRVTMDDFSFVGAFRVPASRFGASSMNFSQGPIALHPERNSVFLVGHNYDQAIAEFTIPDLVNSSVLTELNTAERPVQRFASVLDRLDNPQRLDRLGGMAFLEDGEGYDLLVHAWQYYDAPADKTHTTLMLRDPDDLEGSAVDGFYELEGRAHTNGWVTPIPEALQQELGATHLTGSSGGYPIHSRASIGPTFFTFEPAAFTAPPSEEIPTEALLDYSLANPLHHDLNNDQGDNDIWTHLSRATFGFIPPGSRTYLVIGKSGGHQSGVCYKCIPEGRTSTCAGNCARDATDYATFFWAFDIDDLLDVKAGEKLPHEVRPFAYGPFEIPFSTNSIGGGAFDSERGLLYLTAQRADREREFLNPPVIMVYSYDR